VLHLEDDSQVAAVHFDWPIHAAYSESVTSCVSRYDRLNTVAEETLRRSHPANRHDREEISPQPHVSR
jgi:hypothetical protein